jgi:hypothetical protein
MTKVALLFSMVIVFSSQPALAKKTTEGAHPCKQVRKACEAGGFVKGSHKEGKGLIKDCMKPLLAGAVVAGVTADAGAIQGCQAKKAAHDKKRQHAQPAQ